MNGLTMYYIGLGMIAFGIFLLLLFIILGITKKLKTKKNARLQAFENERAIEEFNKAVFVNNKTTNNTQYEKTELLSNNAQNEEYEKTELLSNNPANHTNQNEYEKTELI